jgi:hypothetical protein
VRERIDEVDPVLVREIVGFLRDWLPSSAISAYRAIMLEDPEHWPQHPHFARGLVVRNMLLGNGLPRDAIRPELLEAVWPELLRLAVLGEETESP